MQCKLMMRRGLAHKAAFIASAAFLFGVTGLAKDAPRPVAVKVDLEAARADQIANLSAGALLTESAKILQTGDYSGALPFLDAYLERMAPEDNARASNLKQEVRLKIGRVKIYMNDRVGALEAFDEYMANKPQYRRREVLKLKAINLFKVGKDTGQDQYFEDCIATVTNAFYNPPLSELVLEDEKKDVSIDEMTKEQLGGLSKRQVKRNAEYAKGAKKDILKDVVAVSGPEMDAEYSVEDRVLLNITKAEACSELERWNDSIEPYRYVIDNSEDSARTGYATMKLVNSLVSLKRYDEAGDFVSELAKTDARYNIRVNLSIMKVAAALQEAEEYDSALALFRMILPRRDLILHQEGRMNEIRVDAGMPEIAVEVVTNSVGGYEAVFGHKSGYLDVSMGNSSFETPEVPPELAELEAAVNQVVALPPYEEDVHYRLGQLYAGAGRPWEAFSVLNSVYEKDVYGSLGQQAFFESLQVLVDPLEEYDRVEKVAYEYLDTYKSGLAPRQVAVALGSCYMKQSKYKEMKKLLPYINSFEPVEANDVRTALQYECEVHYLLAISDMLLLNYQAAEAGFAKLLKNYPGSHQEGNATYWHALSLLFLQQYEDAFAGFETYPVKFPKGRWDAQCSFRGGICLFSMEKYDEALARFTYVMTTWPDRNLYSDAASLRGDLYGYQGELEKAILDYREAIRTADTLQQGTYPVFQMLAVFERQSQHDEIYKAIDEYEARWAEKADVAKAAYWRGKTKMDQGLVEEGLEAYLSAVVKHGGNIKQDGVDLIINEMVNVSRGLEDDESARLNSSIQKSIKEASNPTLKLRLRCLIAQIDKKEVELGAALLAELDNFDQAPPPVLSMICKASFAAEDFSRSEELLNIFKTKFDDSEYMQAAYKLRATALFNAESYEEAMVIVKETQDLYGYAYDAAWAQLMKGKIELKNGSLLSARETFRTVLDIRDWRGESFAEALYYLGHIEEQREDFQMAFKWYQRDYVQYKGYADGYWAAECYLASARCLEKMGFADKQRDTYRAMLFDKYVNKLPQAKAARNALGGTVVSEIDTLLASGVTTNITVTIKAEEAQ